MMMLEDEIQFDEGPAPRKPAGASKPSIKYMRDLLESRKWDEMLGTMPAEWQDVLEKFLVAAANKSDEQIFESGEFAQTDVSKFITQLKLQPKAVAGRGKRHDLEDGIYRHMPQGNIYKVYTTNRGNPAAKRLYQTASGDWAFKYEGQSPLYYLKPEERMEMADAMEFGRIYGQCCICGIVLTHELSIALGIGPICGEREFGGEFVVMKDAKKRELGL